MKRKAIVIINVTSKFFYHFYTIVFVYMYIKIKKKPDTNIYIFLTLHKCKIFRAESAILCIKAWDFHANLMLRDTFFLLVLNNDKALQ